MQTVFQSTGELNNSQSQVDPSDHTHALDLFEIFLLDEFPKIQQSILTEYRLLRPSTTDVEDQRSNLQEIGVEPMPPIMASSQVCSDARKSRLSSSTADSRKSIYTDETQLLEDAAVSPVYPRLPSDEEWSPEDEIRMRERESAFRVSLYFKQTAGFRDSGGPLYDKEWQLAEIAESPAFDMFIALVVFINCIFLCAETQVDGITFGNQFFGYSNMEFSSTLEMSFQVMDYVFLSVYLLEMVFKLSVLRVRYFHSIWNMLDGLTVVISFIMLVLLKELKINPTFVRLVRLAKLLRLTHILRAMTFFDSFLIMTKSLKASVGALFWSLFLIFAMISTSALLLNQLILLHLRQANDPTVEQKTVFLYFGTLTRTIVCMFEMTLGNWGPPTWLLINHVNEGYGLLMIIYKLTAGFAMLNVVNAVFLRLTMREADAFDNYAIEQVKKDVERHQKRVLKLFDILDADGDGNLSFEEFELMFQSNSLRAWMRLMNVSTKCVEGLWRAIDNGDGQVSKDEFMDGFCRLDGPATAVDANSIKSMIHDLSISLQEQRGLASQRHGRLTTKPVENTSEYRRLTPNFAQNDRISMTTL